MSTHLAGFRQDDKYNDGEILDPKTGRIYGTKMTLQDGRKKLNVRGCISFPLLAQADLVSPKSKENLMRWPMFRSDKSG
jgi:uncharacterized protein (DUF2147 family)